MPVPRWRFSLRSLLLVVAAASLLFAMLGRFGYHRWQQVVAAELSAGGANVNLEPRPPAWLPGADRLAAFESITLVDLVGVEIDDSVFDRLAGCADLVYLDLAYSDVSDEQVARLAELSQLRVLNLSSTRVTDASIDTLAQIRSLVDLDLTGTAVTPEGAQRLRQAISHLDLDY